MRTQPAFSVALVALACLVIPSLALGQEGGVKPSKHHLECAEACNECQEICDQCVAHCAAMLRDGKKEHLETLRTCQDCAEVCAAAARIVAQGGPFSDLICQACADACNRCGKACQQFKDDKLMQACAEECFECEKECRAMLKHLGK